MRAFATGKLGVRVGSSHATGLHVTRRDGFKMQSIVPSRGLIGQP